MAGSVQPKHLNNSYVKVYVAALASIAAALAASWIYWYGLTFEARFVLVTVAFASLVLLGEVLPIRVSGRGTIGAWDVGLVLAIVAVGPTWAVLAALPAAFYTGRREGLRLVFEVVHAIVIVYLAGIVFSFASAPLLEGSTPSIATVVYGTLAASLTLVCANKFIMVVLLKIKYDRSIFDTWKEDFEPYIFPDILNVVTATLGALALLVYGPMAAVVVVAGSMGSQVLVYRSREQVRQIGELRAKVGSLEEALTSSNTTLGTMMIKDLGRKDGYTHHHAAATAVYAADLGREMKLDETRVGWLRMAGLLHNIGLFSMPDKVLLETGKLNSIERGQLVEHSVRGEKALAAVPEFEEMASWIRWHHERADGRGYPDKLRASWIPLEAKILAVAQSYAAMVLDQPRRIGMKTEKARSELIAGMDTQFDPTLVRAFLRILDTESEGYRRADDHRFVFPSPDTEEGPVWKAQNTDLKIVKRDP